MKTFIAIIAFPFKLAGKLILLALLLSVVATVVGVAGFLFTPTDTPIGHNITRWELIRAEQEEIAKQPEKCNTNVWFTIATSMGKNLSVFTAMGPMRSFLEIGPVKKIMRSDGSDYQSKNLNFFEQAHLGEIIVSDTVDLALWNFAHSGEPTSTFGAIKECKFPRGFVQLQTPRPDFKEVAPFWVVSQNK